ncbi:MAG: glycine cleavage system protein GcvH [Candidatus Bathyarchaeota archaeon]|nr:MAG: glycine cleavage system protein GcvH [Candidatus Bathyarchaeota archaeon]
MVPGGITVQVLNYDIPDDLYYSKEHEWVRVKGKTAVIGITDYAQKSLHEVVYVEIPMIASQIKQSQSIGSAESVKSVSDIFTPISGEIIDINTKLTESPELVNKDPYGEGWIAKVQLVNFGDDSKKLLSSEQYADYIEALEE